MKVLESYLQKQTRQATLPLIEDYAPITVVIPCYDEPNIIDTLESLKKCCQYYKHYLHIIIVLNHCEESPQEVVKQNQIAYNDIENWKKFLLGLKIKVSIIKVIFENNTGGVGEARKIGIDEAIFQYSQHKKEGTISSLDADTLCQENYLQEIYQHFQEKKQTNTLIIPFKHQLKALSSQQKDAIIQYELYLHYMTLCYRYIGHPNAFHTLGSAFVVKASAYCKQGGMNRRQAGEDFYFLQKIASLGQCYQLNTTCVYPSSRISERVPFGTGKAVGELIASNKTLYAYNFYAFEELKSFFDSHTSLFKINKEDYEYIVYNKVGGLIKSFLIEKDFFSDLESINNNCASLENFSKKFFETFSIFQVIKYLNFSHSHFLQKTNIFHCISSLPIAEEFDFSTPENLIKSIQEYLYNQQFAKI